MQAIASRDGLEYRRRSWGETESLELLRRNVREQFSFQISRRTVAFDDRRHSQFSRVPRDRRGL